MAHCSLLVLLVACGTATVRCTKPLATTITKKIFPLRFIAQHIHYRGARSDYQIKPLVDPSSENTVLVVSTEDYVREGNSAVDKANSSPARSPQIGKFLYAPEGGLDVPEQDSLTSGEDRRPDGSRLRRSSAQQGAREKDRLRSESEPMEEPAEEGSSGDRATNKGARTPTVSTVVQGSLIPPSQQVAPPQSRGPSAAPRRFSMATESETSEYGEEPPKPKQNFPRICLLFVWGTLFLAITTIGGIQQRRELAAGDRVSLSGTGRIEFIYHDADGVDAAHRSGKRRIAGEFVSLPVHHSPVRYQGSFRLQEVLYSGSEEAEQESSGHDIGGGAAAFRSNVPHDTLHTSGFGTRSA